MKLIDDRNKNLSWLTRNYFYFATILIVALNILLHALFAGGFTSVIQANGHWYGELNFNNLARVFLNGIEHSSWQHVLLNMVTFFVCGLYIERKTGSFQFLLLVFSILIVDGALCMTAALDVYFHGASGLVYTLYAYVIVDFLFSLTRYKRNKTNTIFGVIMILLIYAAMCFCGGTETIDFEFYPYDLINNAGHYYSFFAGLLVFIYLNIVEHRAHKEASFVEYKKDKAPVVMYIVTGLISLTLGVVTPLAALNANQRKNIDYIINLDCNIDDYDMKLEYKSHTNQYTSLHTYIGAWGEKLTDAEKEQYIFKIYDNYKYGKPISYGSYKYTRVYYDGNEFVPLVAPDEKTYYIQMEKGYRVTFTYSGIMYPSDDSFYVDMRNGYHTLANISGQNYGLVKENENFEFTLDIYEDFEMEYEVYVNGTLLEPKDGIYTITNVTENKTVVINGK